MTTALTVLERLCGLTLLAALPGCAADPKPQEKAPLFYASLASPSAHVDAQTAAGMISLYRRNNGLGPLAPDPGLAAHAQEAARAMAAADRPASAEALKTKLAAAGVRGAAANLSAGYHTLAEAFSGWRDSPAHNRVMLDPQAARLGIATAYAPGSKYKVYWALVVAPPEGR